MDGVRLIHGDCLAVLPTLESGSVDCVVTDPPYVVKEKVRLGGSGVAPVILPSSTIGDQGWELTKEWLREASRVCRSQIIVFGGYLDLPDLLADRGQGELRGVFVWRKPNAALPTWNVPRYDTEFFVWWGKGRNPTNIKAVRSMVFDFPFPAAGCFATERVLKPGTQQAAHPAQKPLRLMREIVNAFTEPGDIVLDPFMGSGTTGVVCVQTGRCFIGIERSAEYHAIAQRRIAEAVGPLFAPQSVPASTAPPPERFLFDADEASQP